VLFVGSDAHRDDIARNELTVSRDVADAVNVRRIRLSAADSHTVFIRLFVNDYVFNPADAASEFAKRNFRLHFHEAAAALFAHLVGQRAGEIIGSRSVDGRISKAADTVKLRFTQEVEQILKLRLCLSGEAHNKG